MHTTLPVETRVRQNESSIVNLDNTKGSEQPDIDWDCEKRESRHVL